MSIEGVKETADAVAEEARREYLFAVIGDQDRALVRARTTLAAIIINAGGEIVVPANVFDEIPEGTIVDAFNGDDGVHVFTQTPPAEEEEPVAQDEPELAADPELIVEGVEAGMVYFRRGSQGGLERLPVSEFGETFPDVDLEGAPSLSGDADLVDSPAPGRGPAARI